MARRKKGKPLSGWLLINKPVGMTSSAVVNKLRWLYQAQKAGHGGTLDPDATGLLPIAFGEATKFLPFMEDELKCYEFSVIWGAETSTDDSSGELRDVRDARPNREDILAAIPSFLGQIEQIPPQVSAVKVDGERAYDLAREGVEMELRARPLWVEELTLLTAAQDQAEFRFRCGKGGYVRSIGRDLGRKLGCLGHIGALARTETLGFSLDEAYDFEEVLQAETLPPLLPIEDTPNFTAFEVRPEDHAKLQNGNAINNAAYGFEEGDIALALIDGQAAAIVECNAPFLRIARGLVTND